MSDIQVQPAWRAAAGLRLIGESLARRIEPPGKSNGGIPEAAPKAVQVALPARATAPAHIEDATTHVGVDVTLMDAREVAAQLIDGYAVYAKAHRSGATVVERELADGAEDYLSFETRPTVPEVDYQIALGDEVRGVRLVEDTLELLDQDGAPRLRAEPPYVVGADGVRTDATLAVEGCAVDTDAAAPWGRETVDPGARTCTVKVRWPDERVAYPAVLDPRWTTTGSMTTARQGHTATLLSTGNVLVVGGTSNGSTALASAELYNRTTGTWAATGSMTGARTLHTATQLNTGSNGTTSGKVLVAGGLNGTTSQSTAQLYSPSAGTWTAAANLNAARHGQTATLLASGNVLLAGGLSGTTVLNTAAVYNPSSGTGTWTATGTMPQAVKLHTATRLNVPSNGTLNNKVLVVGGNSGTASVSNVQLFDGTSSWSSLTALSSAREGHTATALANGNVLVAGGKSGTTVLNTTQLFNAASGSGSWASAGTMTTARQLHAAMLLPSGLVENGQVLLAGGNNGSSTLSSAELWNGTSTWTATSALPSAVQGETATLLPNNMVLVAGGVNGSTTVAAAALYDASFSLACTSNSQCATGFCVSGVCCDTACNGGCGVCNLAGHVGTCSAASSGTVCRAKADACDVAEICNGSSLTCPTDAVAALGTVCRAANGACDVAETCDGTTKACPADGFAPATKICRASTGTCDAAETCSGTSAACPADAFAPAGTVCRPAAGGCDVAETCSGTSSLCPADSLAAAGTVCRPAESICDVAETCNGSSSVCPADAFAAAGTGCGAASNNSPAPVCSGSAGTCPVASGTSDVLGFEATADWTLDPGDNGTTAIVGLNSNRTQGASSLEVTAQNYARFNSAPVSSIGSVGPLVLLDVMLPTSQANQFWFGDADMFVNSPMLGLFNVFLSDVPLTGLALGTWQTLAFQLPASAAAAIANGVYSDLTFSVVLNVPFNETGHYLIDNIRSIPDVVPSVLGVAQDGATLKAIFDYVTTSSTPVNIPYGTANGLTNQNGFIASPPEVPPTTFVSTTHAPFVATLSGSLLTWTVGSHSATATPASNQLPVTDNGDGTHDATLPDGRKVNIDSVPPPNPAVAGGPPVGAAYNGALTGQFGVSPSGAATYTVPITIPPGVAGMAPNLALAYNSQAGDGLAGWGWNLSGLSMISRCPRTRQQDGYGRPVLLDSLTPTDNQDQRSDGICLDGMKLFEQAPGTPNCPASPAVAMCYSTENTDFSAITRTTAGQFQVSTKAGETRFYDTDVKGPNFQTAIWLLDRVADAWGNYFDIHYNHDHGTDTSNPAENFTAEGIWPSEIDYTGFLPNFNPNGPIAVASSPFTSVTFQYQPQPRSVWHWSRYGALKIPQNQRLSGITTQMGAYSLTYSGDDLTSIGYSAGGVTMKPLEFGWQNSEPGGWQLNSGYALPTSVVAPGKGLKGTQFVDINGDGRPDFVLGRTNGIGGPNVPQVATLLNTGSGWSAPLSGSDRTFPLYLSDQNDNPTGVRFADLDGDGRLDVFVDSANVVCITTQVEGQPQTSSCLSCPVGVGPGNPGCIDPTHYAPAVWLNRFNVDGSGGWQFDPSYSGASVSFTGTNPTMIGDVDGDGKADFIKVSQSESGGIDDVPLTITTSVTVLLNTIQNGQHVWASQSVSYDNIPLFSSNTAPFQLGDVNRDGLSDLVHDDFFRYPDGSVSATETVLVNQGLDATNKVRFGAAPIVHTAPSGGTSIDVTKTPPHLGDIDGDGFHDAVEFASTTGTPTFLAAVGFGDGSGLGFSSDPNQQAYVNVLKAYAPPVCGDFFAGCASDEDYGFALVDINGDGLVDLVRNHQNRINGGIEGNEGGGEILMNNGRTWVSIGGATQWDVGAGIGRIPGVIPSEATVAAGSAFLDLDGDGIVDLIQEEPDTGLGPGAWISPYQRPFITTFPAGLAQPATVSYVTTTSSAGASVYKDDDATETNTKIFAAPLTVVSSVNAEDASGTQSRTTRTYTYHSMRQDPFGRGPLGFHRVEVFDQASQIRTVTTYAQAYPYTGMPTEVDKYQVVGSQSHLTNQTTTLYCDTAAPSPTPPLGCGPVPAGPFPVGTPVFTFPSTVTDAAYLHPETDDLVDKTTTVTVFQFDSLGNGTDTVTQIVKTEGGTTEKFTKEVQNFYDDPQAAQEGKPTKTIETASGGTGPTTHTTSFEYSPVSTFGGDSGRLTITKKRVEPGAGWPIEVDVAYKYDQFGNLVTTTNCASDFGSCQAGATNPAATGATDPSDASDPIHHPPFRTSTVSYDPSVLGVPVSYGIGRFPVKTTSAGGHTETSVYDPVLGKILTKVGPNGIETCYAYDPLGRQTSETQRCGSADPLVTTTQYFLTLPRESFCPDPGCVPGPTGFSPPNSALVTVTTPPTGATTWSYADDQGKATGTLAYSFDGGFIETTTAYNAPGQVTQVAKPFHLASLTDQVSPSYITTVYDSFNRVQTATDPLGVIDSSGSPKTTTIVTTYNGSTIETDRIVNGRTQTRFETKNAIGKVASVTTETETGPSTISYAYDADGNLTLTTDPAGNQVQIGYDTRGRKTSTVDPDMGTWGYTEDGFGDLVSQTDAKGQTIATVYDPLGRMRGKADATGTAQWVYDTAPGAGIGRVAAMVSAPDAKLAGSCALPAGTTVTGGQRAVKTFQYTAFGDVQEVDECIDGAIFKTSYSYDSLGRQSQIRYPVVNNSQLAVGYHYTNLGFLQYLTDDSTDYSILWQVKAMNVLGQVTDEQVRNGVETVANRNPLTGWLMASTATSHADHDNVIQNWSYGFDEIGNLLTRNRADAVNAVTSAETFSYDLTNRLTTSLVTTSGGYNHPESYGYDALGNLTQKAGSAYTYGMGCQAGIRAAGPHAVCTVGGGAAFSYDGNGNLTSSGSRSLTYNPSNKVSHVESDPAVSQGNDTGAVDFAYAADGNRVVQAVTSGGVTARTVYVGLDATGKSLYERTTTGTTVQHVNFIYAGNLHGGSAFALRVLDGGGSVTANRYYHFDHLGSVTAMSDEQGRVSATGTDPTDFGYDAWGARRNPDGTAANPASFNLPLGHREFTAQEQIPDVGLVNLNGRVYDPSLGRFLSPDPNVQFVADLQSYNRYSYAGNNPLRYTDPTGYFWSELGNFFSTYFSNPLNDFELVVGLAACVGSGGAACFVVGLAIAALNATIAIANGAGVGQTLLNAAIGLGIGIATGGLGQELGLNAWQGLLVGAASAAVTTVISNVVTGQSPLGYNVLGAALLSAAQGALTLGLQKVAAVSLASAGPESPEGPAVGQDAARMPITSNDPVAASLVPVTDDQGNVIGYVGVAKFQSSGSGVQILLVYKSVDGCCTDLNWVQTAETNIQVGQSGTGPTVQFVDNSQNPDGNNFYMGRAQQNQVSGYGGYDTAFYDSPGRITTSGQTYPNVQWSAELSLVSESNSNVLITFRYGFSTDATGAVTVQPLTVSSPSPYHQNAIPR